MKSKKKSGLQAVREVYGLTQEQMSGLLNTPRSQLALAETGRREISTHASLKLAELEMIRYHNSDWLPEYENFIWNLDAEAQQFGADAAKEYEFKALQCQRKLTDIEQNYQQGIMQLKLCTAFRQKPTHNEDTREKKWTDWIELEAKSILQKNSPCQQHELKLKIKGYLFLAREALAMESK
jgi:transcriptional regulator with XRE-family HTH domain